jgi:4-amino-4-deoxy-L-arabinose transferase-like glycosyltransferase
MLMLWAGWALTYGIVFSAVAGLFHAYYLAVMAQAAWCGCCIVRVELQPCGSRRRSS